MPNPFFKFKQFTVYHDRCAMKVTTDSCLFGAWCAEQLKGANGFALDIGTGSGLLSLMVAQRTSLQIKAVEIDSEASRQAAENFSRSPWDDRLGVHQGDIREFDSAMLYPVIFSNPPFYENELTPTDPGRLVAHHGSGLGLNGLLQQVNRLLTAEGTAFLLLPAKRELEIEEKFAAAGFSVRQKVVVRPTPAHAPFRLMFSVNRTGGLASTEAMVVSKEKGVYSERFVGLLKDYYLYL